MDVHVDSLTPIALVTMVGLLCGLGMMRLRQPAIVGYILAGIVLGPTGLRLVDNTAAVQLLAEMGVIMLLFLIGMELSLRGFKTVYRLALGTALLQIAFFTLFTTGIGLWLDWSLGRIVVFGFSLALSSTAVVIKILEETGDLKTQVGRTTVAVLIAQDLAVVPMLLIVGALGGGGFDYTVIVKLIFAIGLLIWLTLVLSKTQRLKLPLIHLIENRPDILPLAALAMCFTLATISGVFGLSAAYGAFIAGLIIGNSNARTQMHAATQPIQTVLMMVFFLSIGLLIDLTFILDHWVVMGVLLVLVTLIKTVINIYILHLLGEPWERAFHAGVVLGQIGEFSFILIASGLAVATIQPEGYRLIVSLIALSLMFSPMWLALSRRLHNLAEEGFEDVRGVLTAAFPTFVKAKKKKK